MSLNFIVASSEEPSFTYNGELLNDILYSLYSIYTPPILGLGGCTFEGSSLVFYTCSYLFLVSRTEEISDYLVCRLVPFACLFSVSARLRLNSTLSNEATLRKQ
jgi:hypothetical protein